MELRAFFVFFCLFAAAAAAAQQEAYRWVDEDGVVHYSDRPREGAEAVQLPSPNVATLPVPKRSAGSDDEQQQPDEPAAGYTSIEIASPQAEETLWNIEGVLNVSVALEPGLRPGHQVRAYFDGEMQPVSGTNFQIQEVWRGVHNIQVEVVDATGKVMIRSQPSRFYVQQNTVAF